jgi:hypothetical protein
VDAGSVSAASAIVTLSAVAVLAYVVYRLDHPKKKTESCNSGEQTMTSKPTVNMNDMAKRICQREGGKVNLPIAQVKEVMRLTLLELKSLSIGEVAALLDRVKENPIPGVTLAPPIVPKS